MLPFRVRTCNERDTVKDQTHSSIYFGGLLAVTSSLCPVLHNMLAASGTVAGEDILVSVALLSLKVVQIHMILCMNTCIKLLVEFLRAAYVIF